MMTCGHSQLPRAGRRSARPETEGTPPLAGGARQLAGEKTLTTAFSLIEILVTVTLLSVIVLGLLAMFNQTQRAFRSSMTQTDVLESGRAVMDLLTRELQEMAPFGLNNSNSANFYTLYMPRSPSPATPMTQELPGSEPPRTNVLQEFFFLTRSNQYWSGIGYTVGTLDSVSGKFTAPGDGVATLYRFDIGAHESRPDLITNFSRVFRTAPASNNLHRVADGIVHLRLLAFATNGTLIDTNWNVKHAIVQRDVLPSEVQYWFYSNAVPAYVEVELGVLESQILGRYQSMMGNPVAARAFLEKQAGQVHVFRQRVQIREVDPAVYQ